MDNKVENFEIDRYCRQMILPEIGKSGQLNLKSATVCLIGAGGLASGCALPLAGAGVGHIGVVDGDKVEESNLHRQIVHSSLKIGMNKANSVKEAINAFNPLTKVSIFEEFLTNRNALEICSQFDLLIDCTDNPKSRYLINDVAVCLGIPLVSGAAIKFEGQLTVYHKTVISKETEDIPCYRCLFPKPTSASAVCSCADGGVLGTVPTIIGALQATEAIKIITCQPGILGRKMLLYNAIDCTFKKVNLRGRQKQCVSCGDEPTITKETLSTYDYDAFLKGSDVILPSRVKLPAENEVTWPEGLKLEKEGSDLVDVRPEEQYDVFSLENFENLKFSNAAETIVKRGKKTFVMCRGGNKSTHVVAKCLELGKTDVFNIVDGLKGYKQSVDKDIPWF